jgi:hypothetical protein
LEYFSVAMPVFLKRMAVPVAIAFLADLGMAWFVL